MHRRDRSRKNPIPIGPRWRRPGRLGKLARQGFSDPAKRWLQLAHGRNGAILHTELATGLHKAVITSFEFAEVPGERYRASSAISLRHRSSRVDISPDPPCMDTWSCSKFRTAR